jgi:hypothetical protein
MNSILIWVEWNINQCDLGMTRRKTVTWDAQCHMLVSLSINHQLLGITARFVFRLICTYMIIQDKDSCVWRWWGEAFSSFACSDVSIFRQKHINYLLSRPERTFLALWLVRDTNDELNRQLWYVRWVHFSMLTTFKSVHSWLLLLLLDRVNMNDS